MKGNSVCCPVCNSGYDCLSPLPVISPCIKRFTCCNCKSIFANHGYVEAHQDLHSSRATSPYSSHYSVARKVLRLIDAGNLDEAENIFLRSFKYKFALEYIKSLPSNITILEVGSSSGQFVGFLRALGYEAYGSDISQDAITNAGDMFGEYFFLQSELSRQKKSFDLVVLMGTIGCVDSPSVFMKSLIDLGCQKRKTIIFNAPSAHYIDVTGLKWPDTLPPDLNILFHEDFWALYFAESKIPNFFSQEVFSLSNSFLARLVFSYCRRMNFVQALNFLKIFFDSVFFGKKVPHPYGLLCIAKLN